MEVESEAKQHNALHTRRESFWTDVISLSELNSSVFKFQTVKGEYYKPRAILELFKGHVLIPNFGGKFCIVNIALPCSNFVFIW
jgi:hypothetical protein